MDQLEITSNFLVSTIRIKFDVMNLFESNLQTNSNYVNNSLPTSQDEHLSYLIYTFWGALGTDIQVLSAALNKAIDLGNAVVSTDTETLL